MGRGRDGEYYFFLEEEMSTSKVVRIHRAGLLSINIPLLAFHKLEYLNNGTHDSAASVCFCMWVLCVEICLSSQKTASDYWKQLSDLLFGNSSKGHLVTLVAIVSSRRKRIPS